MRARRLTTLGLLVYGLTWTLNRSARRVEGESMRPLLNPDDLVLTVPAARLPLRRGHVVVATMNGRQVIKRVVGLPGEDVGLSEGHLFVDGTWCREPYAAGRPDTDHRWQPGDDEVVLLGDHRARSTDARHLGPTRLADVEALVVARVRPWQWLASPTMPTDPGARPRPSARLIVLDPDDRVLLFRIVDQTDPDNSFWETPGGGLKARETTLEAAHRELREEVGVEDREILDLKMTTERETATTAAPIHKIQHFFVTRLEDTEVDRSGWTATEHEEIAEVRWWPITEVRGADDLITPDLPQILDRAVEVAQALKPNRSR